MKNALSKTSTVAFLSLLLMLSCHKQGDQSSVSPDESSRLGISQEVAQALVCNGYQLSNIKESDGYLVLESDLIVNKAGLESEVKRNKGAKPSQYAVNTVGVVDYSRVQAIKYFVHSSVQSIPIHGTAWVDAISQVTSQWSSLANVAVRFNAVSDISQADLVFYSDNSSNSTVLPGCVIGLPPNSQNPGQVPAASAFPSNGSPGRYVVINDDNFNTNDVGKRWVIRHELGHTLGYRHSDMYQQVASGGSESVDVPGACGGPILGGNLLLNTPTRDLNSVMISSSNALTDINFNSNDLRAIQLLYMQAPGILSPIQVTNATYSNGNLAVSVPTYQIAFAQLELRIYRRTFCNFQPCYTTVAYTRRFTTAENMNWSGLSVQSGDRVYVFGVNYKGDYISQVSGFRDITIQ